MGNTTKANGETIGTGLNIMALVKTCELIARVNSGWCIGKIYANESPPQGYISPMLTEENILNIYKQYDEEGCIKYGTIKYDKECEQNKA